MVSSVKVFTSLKMIASVPVVISVKMIASVRVVSSVKIIDSVKGFNHEYLNICIFKNLPKKALVVKYFSSVTWLLATFWEKFFHFAHPQVILALMIPVSSLYYVQWPSL